MSDERVSGNPVIWWGMVIAPFIYAGLVLFVVEPRPASTELPFPAILAGIGVVEVLVAQVLWVRVRSGALRTLKTGDGGAAPGSVVVWALDEAPAALGLIIAILGGPLMLSFTLMGISLLALLMNAYWTLES